MARSGTEVPQDRLIILRQQREAADFVLRPRTDVPSRAVPHIFHFDAKQRSLLAFPPERLYPSTSTMARDVFIADSIRVLSSSGQVVRGSITSALIPLSSSKFAASSAICTMLLVATSVMSVPSRFTSATPNGMVYSSSGTAPFSLYIILSSKKTTGLSSRIAVLSSPLASYGVDGKTTFSPGT